MARHARSLLALTAMMALATPAVGQTISETMTALGKRQSAQEFKQKCQSAGGRVKTLVGTNQKKCQYDPFPDDVADWWFAARYAANYCWPSPKCLPGDWR